MRGQQGFSLIEAIVALVLFAVVTVGMYNVAVSAQRSDSDFTPYEAATRSVQRLDAALRNYVTADHSAATASHAPDGSWRLPGDTSACAFWALSPLCPHEATAFLDPRFKARYPAARLTYRVTQPTLDSPSAVEFTVSW